MVGKLIKHDFLESRRKFAPVIGMIIAVTFMLIVMFNSSFYGTGAELVLLIMTFLVFGLSISSFVMTIMALIDLLYTSVYNKRGYQLFTMPVKSWEILVSKLVLVFIWMSIIGLVTLICGGTIMLIVFGKVDVLDYFASFFSYLFSNIDVRVYAVSLFSSVVGTIYSFSLFMFVGSIVHSCYVQNGRNYKMLIFYLIAVVLISSTLGKLMSSDMALQFIIGEGALNGEMLDPLVNGWGQLFSTVVNVGALKATLWFSVLEGLIATSFMYGTIWFWNNKLEVID